MESMHLLAPAGEVVLTLGVALKIVTPKLSKNHLSCFSAILPKLLLRCKTTNMISCPCFAILMKFNLDLESRINLKEFASSLLFPKIHCFILGNP
jgi:hypothetical protein